APVAGGAVLRRDPCSRLGVNKGPLLNRAARIPADRYRGGDEGEERVTHAFQVDLRGMVDLLSHHLYGSPRVYVRELLPNAGDATPARRVAQPDEERALTAGGERHEVRIDPPEITGDGTLRVHDTGIGLTTAQVHELLATIGRSSKRDELGFARHEFL